MSQFRADLHCHSTCSDGTTAPEKIVEMAAESGLSALSITDHDTIDAYVSAVPAAKRVGIELLPGVELSSVQDDVSIHILAYAFPLDSPVIRNFCLKHHLRRQDRNRLILELLAKHQMPIEEEELHAVIQSDIPKEKRTIGRPHIAQVMVKKGYVESIQEAFYKYIGEGKSCYSQGESFSTQETIDTIHAAKGLAIIAHPQLINQPAVLQKLLTMNFDGIECYYAKLPRDSQKRWIKIAEKRQWLMTGGSDYHGSIKPQIPLGASWIDEQQFEKLRTHYAKVSS